MIPYVFIVMLLCVAGFFWFVTTEARREPKHHWFVVALFYGIPLAATLAIACTTGAFCGINVISYREITFDPQSVSFGILFGGIAFIIICFVQILALAVLRRFTRRYWIRLCAILIPVILGAIIFCGKAAYAALPEQRFTQFIGIEAPSSVSDITYSRYTSGFFTSVQLTCRASREDAERIMKQSNQYIDIKYDPTNSIIKATHASD